MNKKFSIGLLAALTLTSPVRAEAVDEIVVSATGIPTPISQIGSSVDVITTEDLDRQQITYLQDALKLRGINVPQSGGVGTLSNVFLRGLPGKYTDLVVDGISMYDPRSGQVLWQDVVTDGVDQVEILRGSQGLLFGSNTIAGVISQFTKIGGEASHMARLETGEFGTAKLSLNGAGSSGGMDYGYAVSKAETDGISAWTDPTGDDDGYENTTFNALARFHASDELVFDLVLRGNSGESEFDNFGADAVGRSEEYSRQAVRFAAKYNRGKLGHSLSFNQYDAEIDSITNFVKTAGDDSSRDQSEYRLTVDSNRVDWVFGLEDTEISREITGSSYASNNTAIYGMLVLNLSGQTNVTLGVRQDDHQYFGQHTTHRSTIAHSLQRIVLRAAYGTGFRAPNLFELYSDLYGNQDLEPETSESIELGFDLAMADGYELSATAYLVEIDDLIDWVSTPQPNDPWNGEYRQVTGTSDSKGLEVSMSGRLSDALSANIDLSYQDSKVPDGAGGLNRQVRVPRLQAHLAVNYSVSEVMSFGIGLHHKKSVIDSGVELNDYTLLNLNSSYQLNDRVKVYGRLENAMDEDYETVSGYGTLGRAFYVGVSSRF